MSKLFSYKYSAEKKSIFLTFLGIKFRMGLNFEQIMIKNLKLLFKISDLIIPKNKKKIVFYLFPKFENNVLVFYNYLKENHADEFDFCFISTKDLKYNLENCFDLMSLKALYAMYTSKYVVTTHDSVFLDYFKSNKHIYLNLWHGMPIKTLGFTEKSISKVLENRYNFLSKNAHFFVTSDLFKLSMLPCFGANYYSCHITGQPRTDIIGSLKNEAKIKEKFALNKFSKVILYLPTWKTKSPARKQQISLDFNNIFYMDDYNEEDFIKTLEENNILFIMKPHPIEENFYMENPNVIPNSKNFRILFNEELIENSIDLYEMFKHIDLMISDYSSVTIDYLLLNKPVLYLNNLSEDYSAGRGMILEDNFEVLMPGKKVLDYENLSKEILANLLEDTYKNEREKALPLIHKYRDFNSSKRVYEVMKELSD